MVCTIGGGGGSRVGRLGLAFRKYRTAKTLPLVLIGQSPPRHHRWTRQPPNARVLDKGWLLLRWIAEKGGGVSMGWAQKEEKKRRQPPSPRPAVAGVCRPSFTPSHPIHTSPRHHHRPPLCLSHLGLACVQGKRSTQWRWPAVFPTCPPQIREWGSNLLPSFQHLTHLPAHPWLLTYTQPCPRPWVPHDLNRPHGLQKNQPSTHPSTTAGTRHTAAAAPNKP